jgi:hypothetical protein
MKERKANKKWTSIAKRALKHSCSDCKRRKKKRNERKRRKIIARLRPKNSKKSNRAVPILH